MNDLYTFLYQFNLNIEGFFCLNLFIYEEIRG